MGQPFRAIDREPPLSYMELVEVAFVASFRRFGVPLQRVRKARDYYAQRFEVEYPFAELRLQTEGHHVLMELLQIEPDTKLRGLIVGDAHGQLAWQDVISDRFLEFDYELPNGRPNASRSPAGCRAA